MPGYVTAFAGRRDDYQVPLALHEAGRLDGFLTTLYAHKWLRRLSFGKAAGKLNFRLCSGLPDGLVRSDLFAELIEQAGRWFGVHPPRYWRYINDRLSERAGRVAARHDSDLLLYEPYAWQAFSRSYPGRVPRKVLFHFHPHPQLEAEILEDDNRRYSPAGGWSKVDGESGLKVRNGGPDRAWTLADRIICASSFTRRSLVRAGASPDICRVIPYGIEAPENSPPTPPLDRFRVLFLGSGIQRKGLHHLLTAWKMARLPANAELTVVCRSIDPAMKPLLNGVSGLRFLPGAGSDELKRLFAETSLLTVPSLIEGFGAVYLEAAAKGRPVLGTENTCVPDIGSERDGFFVCRPGDPVDLAERLSEISQRVMDQPDLGQRAWAKARLFPWRRFRSELVQNLP